MSDERITLSVTMPATDAPSVIDEATDIGIARRARVAESESARLRAEVESLRSENAELRRITDGKGDLHAEGSKHDYRCSAYAQGGGVHPLVSLHGDTRTVKCRVCGTLMDAFDVLMQYAHAERRFSYGITSMREEFSKLRKDIEALKKERSSLKSQVKVKRKRAEATP